MAAGRRRHQRAGPSPGPLDQRHHHRAPGRHRQLHPGRRRSRQLHRHPRPFTDTWSALGSGLGIYPAGVVTIGGTGGPLDTDLCVAGIPTAGGNPVNGLARWTGSAWQNFGGSGVGSNIEALTTLNGQPVAGGWITDSDGEPLYNIARWNGTRWTYVASGGTDARVRALLNHPTGIIAAGDFIRMDDVPRLPRRALQRRRVGSTRRRHRRRGLRPRLLQQRDHRRRRLPHRRRRPGNVHRRVERRRPGIPWATASTTSSAA